MSGNTEIAPRRETQHRGFDLILLASIWIAMLLVVNPIGDFPLNDDWTYALVVKNFLETGDFRPSWWVGAQILTNVLWGALFCFIPGFSFTALRISTLVASLLAIFGCYVLLRELRAPRWYALVATLTLAFNPIYYELSLTFMTDVLFLTLTLWSAVFFTRSLTYGGHINMAIATIFSLFAALSREIGLCIPVAFFAAHLFHNRRAYRQLIISLIPSVVCVVSFVAFKLWLVGTGRTQGLSDPTTDRILAALTNTNSLFIFLSTNVYIALLYLGLFLLPVVFVLPYRDRIMGRTARLSAVGASIFLCCFCLHAVYVGDNSHAVMPVGGNILAAFGLGPIVLRDVVYLNLNVPPPLPPVFWISVTALGVLGAIFAIIQLTKIASSGRPGDIPERVPSIVQRFFGTVTTLYFVPVLLTNPLFDEYLLPLIPFISATLVPRALLLPSLKGRKFSLPPLTLLLVGFGVYAVFGTRDYLMLNRVRWTALSTLQRDLHVGPADIDGGYEFNGWYLFDPNHVVQFNSIGKERSFWWVVRDDYLLTLGPVPGYKILRRYSYENWLPPRTQRVTVLRRTEPSKSKY